MLSSLLSEYSSSSPSVRSSPSAVDLTLTALLLLQDTIPILNSCSSVLFGSCLSSVISCFCTSDLVDEVCRIIFMYIEFYGLEEDDPPFLIDTLVQVGMEHDDDNVRLMCLNIVPRLAKSLNAATAAAAAAAAAAAVVPSSSSSSSSSPPSSSVLYVTLLTGCVGRVRDVSDAVVQASILVLSDLNATDATAFEDGRSKLDELHKKLVAYYQEEIYEGGGGSITPLVTQTQQRSKDGGHDEDDRDKSRASGKTAARAAPAAKPQQQQQQQQQRAAQSSSPSRLSPKVPPLSGMSRIAAAGAGHNGDDDYYDDAADPQRLPPYDDSDYGKDEVTTTTPRPYDTEPEQRAKRQQHAAHKDKKDKYETDDEEDEEDVYAYRPSDEGGGGGGGNKNRGSSGHAAKGPVSSTKAQSVLYSGGGGGAASSSSSSSSSGAGKGSTSSLMRVQSFGEMPPFLSTALDKSFNGISLDEEGRGNSHPYVPSWQSSPEPKMGGGGGSGSSLDLSATPNPLNTAYSKSPAGKKLQQHSGFVPPSVEVVVDNKGYDDDDMEAPASSSAAIRSSGSTSPNRADQLSEIKKRQESRRAARRALSANNADERRVRGGDSQRNGGLDSSSGSSGSSARHNGPGTPIAVGSYAGPDGIRTNFETHEMQHSPLVGAQRQSAAELALLPGDDNRPIRPMNRRISAADDDKPTRFDDDLLLDDTGDGGGGGGGFGGSSSSSSSSSAKKQPVSKTVSTATRKRMERAAQQEQNSEMELLDSQLSSPPVAQRVNKAAGRAAQQHSPRSNDLTETWAKDARTTISFHGSEHVSSSLRAEAHDYLTTDDIRPSPNPQQELQKILGGAGVDEWPEVFHALNSIRRLALHHSASLEAHVHAVFRIVLKAIDNLRSAVSKNAILTLSDMWRGMGRSMDPELITVVPVLLKRFSEINGFLIEVADDAISVLITHATDTRVLAAFMASAGNKLPALREKSASVTLRIIEQMDSNKLSSCREFDKLLAVVPMWCQDRQSETRVFGRQIAAYLVKQNVVDETKMQSILPQDVYAKVEQCMVNGVYLTPLKKGPGGMGGPGLGGGGGGGAGTAASYGEFTISGLNPTQSSSKQHRMIGGGNQEGASGGVTTSRQRAAVGDDSSSTTSGGGGGSATKSPGPRKDGAAGGVNGVGGVNGNGTNNLSSPSPLVATVNMKELEVLQDYFASMRSNEWKERQTATQKLVELALKVATKLPTSGKMVSVFDRLSERLSDGNQKVNVTALEGCDKCIAAFGDKLEGALPVLVPALAGNLARTPKLVALAKTALDTLARAVDPRLLCQPFVQQAEHGSNVRIKSFMMAKLVEITPKLFDCNKAVLLSKHVIPLALRLLDENKGEIKAINNNLLLILYSAMGGKFIEQVSHLNEEDMEKLNVALNGEA